jgi:hypothetical protein
MEREILKDDILSVDDWELTLKELKNQRVQLTLNLAVVNAAIKDIEPRTASFHMEKNQEDGKPKR